MGGTNRTMRAGVQYSLVLRPAGAVWRNRTAFGPGDDGRAGSGALAVTNQEAPADQAAQHRAHDRSCQPVPSLVVVEHGCRLRGRKLAIVRAEARAADRGSIGASVSVQGGLV